MLLDKDVNTEILNTNVNFLQQYSKKHHISPNIVFVTEKRQNLEIFITYLFMLNHRLALIIWNEKGARSFLKFRQTIESGLTLKLVRDMMIRYRQ